jgi:peptide/nickel transport system substrate-binding protein
MPSTLNISTVPAYVDIAEQIKKDWEKLNIKTGISVSPDIPTDFQILLVAQSIPVDPDQYSLWHSTQESTNFTRLNNPRIDKLLEDGRKTYDINTRKKIYQDFQKYLVEEAPAVFLFYPHSYTIIRK